MSAAISRGLRAFGRFWWEFVVGDTPELFVATLVVVAVSFALASLHVVPVVVVPAVAVASLLWSAARGRVRERPGA